MREKERGGERDRQTDGQTDGHGDRLIENIWGITNQPRTYTNKRRNRIIYLMGKTQ